MKNPYRPNEAVIEDIIEETPTIKTFTLKPKEPLEFKTGQFVQLTIPGLGEAPFTPSSNPNIKEKIELTVMNVGRITQALHQLPTRALVGLRGPYGEGYPLEDFTGKQILVVGGGVGLAPLRSLLFSLFSQLEKYERVVLKYGARTPRDLVYKDSLFKEWREKIDIELTVDKAEDNWRGKVGVVTTVLDNLKLNLSKAVAIVCGPPIMMKFSTFKLLDVGLKPAQIYLSMERNMSCGMGMCGHCRLGPYYVCKDGPVFCFEKIKDITDIWG